MFFLNNRSSVEEEVLLFTWLLHAMNFLWRVGLLAIDIMECDNLHDKQGAMISNNALASIKQKKTFKYLLTINDTDDDKKIIYFFKSNETDVEHSKSYKSQVRATWSVNCFTERRDLVRGYRETSNFFTTNGYTVRGGVGSMLSESLSLSKCVIFRYPISDLSEPLLKREKP